MPTVAKIWQGYKLSWEAPSHKATMALWSRGLLRLYGRFKSLYFDYRFAYGKESW